MRIYVIISYILRAKNKYQEVNLRNIRSNMGQETKTIPVMFEHFSHRLSSQTYVNYVIRLLHSDLYYVRAVINATQIRNIND